MLYKLERGNGIISPYREISSDLSKALGPIVPLSPSCQFLLPKPSFWTWQQQRTFCLCVFLAQSTRLIPPLFVLQLVDFPGIRL